MGASVMVTSSSDFKRPFIVIPTYNERENLPRLLEEIFRLPYGFHVLVVDDGSPDGTGEWVAQTRIGDGLR